VVEKMKTSKIGIVAAAILMVASAVGFGIAQAGGYSSDNPAWTLQDQAAVEQYNDFAVGPSGADWPASGPMETGAVPGSVHEESWMRGYGND
jgi:hypothetical protein